MARPRETTRKCNSIRHDDNEGDPCDECAILG